MASDRGHGWTDCADRASLGWADQTHPDRSADRPADRPDDRQGAARCPTRCCGTPSEPCCRLGAPAITRPTRQRSSTSSTSVVVPAAWPCRSPPSATGSPSSTPARTPWRRWPAGPASPASRASWSPGRVTPTSSRSTDLSFDATFDLALCHGLLEHVDDPAQALAGIARALRPRRAAQPGRRPAQRGCRRRPRCPVTWPGPRPCSTTRTADGATRPAHPALRPGPGRRPGHGGRPAGRRRRRACGCSPTSCPASCSSPTPPHPRGCTTSTAAWPASRTTPGCRWRCTCWPAGRAEP